MIFMISLVYLTSDLGVMAEGYSAFFACNDLLKAEAFILASLVLFELLNI